MMKYKVSFSGFAYVEADTPEEAEELYHDGFSDYEEWEVTEVEEIDEFLIEM